MLSLTENLARRQQLLALRAKRPRRRLTAVHKLFWVILRIRLAWEVAGNVQQSRSRLCCPLAGFEVITIGGF